ncbi:MAG: OFA family MFS transporter [Firmicutes bacterium]|nr:OFA family MFS transporter [Bacillota bacterium]
MDYSYYMKKRWFVLVVSCLINLCAGSIYAWSVFSVPMEAHLNETYGLGLVPGGLAIVFTIANMVGPITMIPGGKINDSLGPRWVVFIGGIIFGGGMFMCGFANSVLWLIICYSLGCGLGMGMIYGCNISNAVKFFPDKKGVVGGLTTACYGISSVIIPPIANALNQSVGVTMSFKIFGVIFLVVICVGGLLQIKCPEEFIENFEINSKAAGTPAETVGEKPAVKRDFPWNEMLKSPFFYLMLFMLMCGAVSGLMCISQASGMATSKVGMTASAAALAVSVLALFNTGGRVVAGLVSDKIGRLNTLLIALFCTIGGLVILAFAGNTPATFYPGICLIGISFGSFMGVFPAFTADQFGPKNNSVNFGIMFIGFAVAGYVGPTIMKTTLNSTGSYNLSFVLAAVLAVVGIVLLMIFKALQRKANRN